ncbi:MAG: hypothetical protein IMW99_01075 [Firmicutes bacterium]|nr:hypothetical protein [Bacillota bacterium]
MTLDNTRNAQTFLSLLDRLEHEVASAPRIPISGRALVDPGRMRDLIGQLRQVLPEEIRRAERLAAERERLLAEAQKQAEDILRQAQAHVQRMLDENSFTQQAQAEAKRLLKEAERDSLSLRRGATLYARQVLSDLQSKLNATLQVVQRGQQELERQMQEAAQDLGLAPLGTRPEPPAASAKAQEGARTAGGSGDHRVGLHSAAVSAGASSSAPPLRR